MAFSILLKIMTVIFKLEIGDSEVETLLLKKIFNVYFFERERERQSMSSWGQRKRETESEAGSRLWAVCTEPNAGLKLKNCKMVTPAEVDA